MSDEKTLRKKAALALLEVCGGVNISASEQATHGPGRNMRITWHHHARDIASASEFEDCVRDVGGRPTMVFLHTDQGSLGVGVGHASDSVLLYGSTSTGEIFHAIDSRADDPRIIPPLVFAVAEREVSFFDRIAIPVALANAVTGVYLRTGGRLSPLVDWEPEGSWRPSGS